MNKKLNLFINLKKLDLPNDISDLQLLTIIFLEWMNGHY
jgi:hypothetical protein